MQKYTWIPVFKAITQWIKSYETKQGDLVSILEQLGIEKGLTDLDTTGQKVPLQEIDPFTFFAIFMKFGEDQRQKKFQKFLDISRLDEQAPTDFSGVPSAQALKVWLFPYLKSRGPDTVNTLWRLFHAAETGVVSEDLFKSALAIEGTGFTKLTQCLFYCFPDLYLPIDSQTKHWLADQGVEYPRPTWESYKYCLDEVTALSEKPFCEISYEAWLNNQKASHSEIPSQPAISENAKAESAAKKALEMPLNQILYGPPGTGKTYHTTELAIRIADPEWFEKNRNEMDPKAFRKALKARFDELARMERIMFTTFHQSFAYEDFIEGIRARSDPKTNQLSYPVEDGVFKRLCKNADKKVVEHQSISPEQISKRAIWKMSLGNTQTEEAEEVFTECRQNNYVLLGWGGDVDFTGCNDFGAVKARYLEHYPDEKQEYAFQAVNTFRNHVKKGDLIVISDGNSRFRAIAEVTGEHRKLEDKKDWFHQARDVKWIQVYEKSRPASELYSNQFTQKTLYRLNSSKIRTERLLDLVAADAPDEDAPPHVLIIDEINRGNIARIFGELITLLEPSKRAGAEDEQSVILPYSNSKEPFAVPGNVFVIGTMNTADKSLAQLDLALRRRFNFIEMKPNPASLSGIHVFDQSLESILDVMNQRIEILLDSEHQIGHAYFMELQDLDSEASRRQAIRQIFRNKVLPLLQEYFFEDYERIGWVLNDPSKAPEHKFITTGTASNFPQTQSLTDLFPGEIAEQLVDSRYRINETAFDTAEAYRQIVGSP